MNVPIDIHLKKLLDWLISRRICNNNWHDHVRQIREKIGGAIGDMPEHEKIKELLSGAHIHYWHTVEIVEILKETEKSTKNFLGQYGSQRMSDWKEVVNLYQKDSVYLADAAQLLIQAVVYELPGLKRQLAKLLQIEQDCDKKKKENDKRTVECEAEFQNECKQLGIQGKRPRAEIIAILDDLPQIYDHLAKDSRKLESACQAYSIFCKAHDPHSEEELLPTLNFLIRFGNVTTYQWVHGEPPISVELSKLYFGQDEDDSPDDPQDAAGGENDSSGRVPDIDFDLDLSSVQLDAPVDIDWGDLCDEEPAEDVKIDWDAVVELNEVEVTEAGLQGGVARESEALSILDNRQTRNLLLDDLHELQCFLEQRIVELSGTQDSFSSLVFQSEISVANSAASQADQLRVMLTDVSSLIQQLSTGKLHHLQLIKSSPSYVDRLVGKLKMKSSLALKFQKANQALVIRREQAVADQADTQRKLNLIKAKASQLQRHIEQDISARYQGRQVSIIGGVQFL